MSADNMLLQASEESEIAARLPISKIAERIVIRDAQLSLNVRQLLVYFVHDPDKERDPCLVIDECV